MEGQFEEDDDQVPNASAQSPDGPLDGVFAGCDEFDDDCDEHDDVVQPNGDEDDEPGPLSAVVQPQYQQDDEDGEDEPRAKGLVHQHHRLKL